MITDEMVEAAARAIVGKVCPIEGAFKRLDESGLLRAFELSRAALEAAEQAAWQDIGTAPKDGTEVDLWCVDSGNDLQSRVTGCRWGTISPSGRQGWQGISQRDRCWVPVKWRHLSEPPA